MSNPYFRFKQFTVYHDKCAMKVGTDGVLLGAWADGGNARRILDIGTGTGLVALMLAQRNVNAALVGIDVDERAARQARENVRHSPFSGRIVIENISVQDFAKKDVGAFDLIVSNPPFFARSLPSPERSRTVARHAETLSPEDLFACASCLLSDDGVFSLIYPMDNLPEIELNAEKQRFFLQRKTVVFPTPTALPKRALMTFSKKETLLPVCDELLIEVERHRYSEEFIELAKDFYLNI